MHYLVILGFGFDHNLYLLPRFESLERGPVFLLNNGQRLLFLHIPFVTLSRVQNRVRTKPGVQMEGDGRGSVQSGTAGLEIY